MQQPGNDLRVHIRGKLQAVIGVPKELPNTEYLISIYWTTQIDTINKVNTTILDHFQGLTQKKIER